MYIDILLALAFGISIYILWRRVSDKIPELIATPDQDLSVLLEQNTAKLQRFFLHVFHFRSFYRERRYHANIRLFVAKLLYRIHIIVLRLDNRIVLVLKRMRTGDEAAIVPENTSREYTAPVQAVEIPVSEKINQVQEVRVRKNVSFANTLKSRRTAKTKAALVNDRTLMP